VTVVTKCRFQKLPVNDQGRCEPRTTTPHRAGGGIDALGNAGGQAMVSIKNSVIAKNGAAGVQANGANAGVLIGTTLLDQNVAGATTVVGGGNIYTTAITTLSAPWAQALTRRRNCISSVDAAGRARMPASVCVF
jgi:hypothetical protein